VAVEAAHQAAQQRVGVAQVFERRTVALAMSGVTPSRAFKWWYVSQ
jgi:hypothetical protein